MAHREMNDYRRPDARGTRVTRNNGADFYLREGSFLCAMVNNGSKSAGIIEASPCIGPIKTLTSEAESQDSNRICAVFRRRYGSTGRPGPKFRPGNGAFMLPPVSMYDCKVGLYVTI